jgi:hypothetical protein
MAAIIGDIIGKIGITFPMTTFRLKNMTTDSIVDLAKTIHLVPELPYSRIEGIHRTLEWLKENKI